MTIMLSFFSSFWCEKDDDSTWCHHHPFLVWSRRTMGGDDKQRVTHVECTSHCHFFSITHYYCPLLFFATKKTTMALSLFCFNVILQGCK
jgi:hypothetical protein